jgi:acyl carrier protein phosphodiesterase
MDVMMDYLLLKNWGQYSGVPIQEFTAMIYRALMAHHSIMPEFLRERLPHMIRENWLIHYGTEEGLEYTFSRMKLRSSQPWKFDYALRSLGEHLEDLETAFHSFFPEMSEAATSWIEQEVK